MEETLIVQGYVEYTSMMLVIALEIYMFSFEVFQMLDKKFEYFKELQNIVDDISSVLVIAMIVKNEWFID